ncbi:hypothetical protein [Nocardioides zhouii]|uniref:S1 family peptidase n=1 Tax=Nocardioides zhouii TaxID=1168729 RepID=A0A4Q2T1K7_9ACTN|nr:hypothetical protein [Nocardioides zhouii]RYC10824.1 hypothetical protein EUA94_11450 [Nocardioides zhouii]
MLKIISVGLVGAFLAATLPSSSSNASNSEYAAKTMSAETDLPHADVGAYMELFNVPESAALEQLAAQQALSQVSMSSGDNFAGFEIIRGAEFVINAYVTAPPSPEFSARLEQAGLSHLVKFEYVDASLARLQKLQDSIRLIGGRSVSTVLDVQKNRVEVALASHDLRRAIAERLVKEDQDDVIFLEAPAAPDDPTVGGGGATSTCTAGFVVVKSSTGNRGVSTAGHCPDAQSYKNVALNFKGEAYGGTSDIQWHDSGALTWQNRVEDGVNDSTPFFRNITSREATSSIALGNFYCKTGSFTGYLCGTVSAVNYCPSYGGLSCDFFLLSGSSDMSADGDSGGPVYVNEKAVGTTSGRRTADGHPYPAIIGPQATFSKLGLVVAIS